jgi:choline dehydrogenase-like flavoprotein
MQASTPRLPAPSGGPFDYVIVGGGVAGCVVAARLSENPCVRILLLEAGPENHFEHSSYSTGAHQMWEGESNWHTASTPQTELGGRVIDQPRGKLIGGSAAINVGSWSRGVPADYDAWEEAGAAGWGWATARRLYQAIEASGRPDGGARGRHGPMHLEDTPVGSRMTDLMREACLAAGIGATEDHNGARVEGFDLWETIFPNGRRRNTAEAYLAPARQRPNLTVFTGTLATRVTIQNGRANGVEYEVAGVKHNVAARAEVVLCAGAFMSPQLLMLSGIGPADHLREHGIPLVADLPGVGSNLIDHVAVVIGAVGAPGSDIPPVYPNPDDPAELETWRRTGYGPLSVTEYTSIAFTRSRPELLHPDIELLFDINPPRSMREDKTAGGFCIFIAHVTPSSRGEVRLGSADPHTLPLIDYRYLSDPGDLAVLIAGVRLAMAVAATPPLSAYGVRRDYDPDASDDAIAAKIRADAITMFHPVGTARMGSTDDHMAVLDPTLQVRGVEGLRVVDASAMPGIIRGHTMAPTVFLAERGAELIKESRT